MTGDQLVRESLTIASAKAAAPAVSPSGSPMNECDLVPISMELSGSAKNLHPASSIIRRWSARSSGALRRYSVSSDSVRGKRPSDAVACQRLRAPPSCHTLDKTDRGLTEGLQPKWSCRSSGNSTCGPNGGSWPD